MAGFDYEAGRSNNMVLAEARGMVTIGRWAKKYKVSAAAAQHVMCPTEAHHTGTGFRGKSRLTYVIEADLAPTGEQLAAMQVYDPEQVARAREERAEARRAAARAEVLARPLRVNEYGNVDVRGDYNGVMLPHLPAPREALVAAGVVFGEAMTGFTKSRGRYSPDLSGWVLANNWEAKLAASNWVAPPPPPPVIARTVEPEREARPLTADEISALEGADLDALRPMKRRDRKSWLFAAKLPNRAEALDWVAAHVEDAVLA